MALSNRDRVGKALDLTAGALGDFVARILGPHLEKGVSWTSILQVLDAQKPGGAAGKVYAETDVLCQLRVMTERLGEVGFPFSATLSRAEQNLAGELREVRHRWAHGLPFSYDDTYRALDTCERLLRAVGAPTVADQLKNERQEFQRSQFESQTRKDVRDSAPLPTLGDVDLTPWRDVLKPHPDVLSGRFKLSEFAANLHSVAHGEGQGSPEYDDPVEFFRRTYLTTGLRDLLAQAAGRVTGAENAAPVINLQTTFGGGKTHSMLAVWHLFSGTPLTELPQEVQELAHSAGLTSERVTVRRAAVVGNEIAPGQAHRKDDGTEVRTIWGEIAWQLGGKEGFDLLAESDRRSTSPGRALREVLSTYAPCVVLIDEWVAYARQLRDQDDLPAGTFETQFTFAQLLTEAVAATPGVLLLVSIPASDVRMGADGEAVPVVASELETGGAHGKAALERLEHVVGRVAHQWQPASSQESFEIVRRRLFEEADAQAARQIAATARKFVNFYVEHSGEFPRQTREATYEQRLRAAYPIHPELFARLYEDWSTLERFQRTRGVLRLMSAVVKELHDAGDDSPLIMPGSLPVHTPSVVGELTQYVDGGWKAVIDADVDGPDSLPYRIDRERPLFGKRALTRRIARATFLGSAATLKSAHKGIDRQNVFLGVAMPGDTVGNFGSSLQMLADQASYLFSEGQRFWYDLQPSLNRVVGDRASALDAEDVWNEVVKRLQAAGSTTGADIPSVVVAPTDSSDVAEADSVRLVLLHPQHTHAQKATDSPALKFAGTVVGTRGSGNREKRNTLVFLAPDEQRLAELESIVRQHLAWRSVIADKLHLDLTQQQELVARAKVDETNKVVEQRITTSWIWGLYPTHRQADAPFVIGTVRADGDESRLALRTGRKLVKEDILRVLVAPAALRFDLDTRLQRVWNNGRIRLGDLWDLYTRYAYLPRLRDRGVLVRAVEDVMMDAGWAQEGFALARGYNEATGDFDGLALPLEDDFGHVDDDTWLVAPHVASAQRQREQHNKPEPKEPSERPEGDTAKGASDGGGTTAPASVPSDAVHHGRYQGRYEVDTTEPGQVGEKLRLVAEEVLRLLIEAKGSENVEIVLEVSAENYDGFDERTVRTVRENSRVLGFDESDFEDVQL